MDEKKAAELLRSRGWGVIPPDQWRIDMEEEFLELWEKAAPFTMTSIERGYGLYQGLKYVLARGLEGDLAECGVWKGGSCMLMAMTLGAADVTDRRIFMYDTFTGMTEPSDEDIIAWNNLSVSGKMADEKRRGVDSFAAWAVGMKEVASNLRLTGCSDDIFRMVPGDVEDTIKNNPREEDLPEKLALLRLDTDWYISTKTELEILYPRLVSGGVLVIDDYGHFKGARQAVDEYFASLPPGESALFNRLDYTGRLLIKP